MLFGQAHILLAHGAIGISVVAFLLVPCLMARKVDLNADDLIEDDGPGDGA
jgi:hypothetical protein